MHTRHSSRPTPGPSVAPRAARRVWWPFALGAVVVAAAASWAAHAPAAASPKNALPGEEVFPQDARSVTLLGRAAQRTDIARAVARGEVNLLTAAAAYRDLEANDPEAVAHRRRAFPGVPDAEQYVRAVIQRVRVEVNRRQADPAVADRLEAELDRHRAGGTLVLPASAGVTTI